MTNGFGCNGCEYEGCPNYKPRVEPVVPERVVSASNFCPPLADDECSCASCRTN